MITIAIFTISLLCIGINAVHLLKAAGFAEKA